jgi:preprotein translocase subunit SecY
MFEFLNNLFPSLSKFKGNPQQKILITFLILFIFRFGNTIPLEGIDQEALKKAFINQNTQNSVMQIINMYSGGGGTTLLSPFSLGIIPFINASILIDILTSIIPKLEKLQSEEGENGREKLFFYKKILTFIFSIAQSIFLIFYLKSYFYNLDFGYFLNLTVSLVTGSMTIVWLSSLIDNKGVGNGTSIIIFTNIVVTLVNKNLFQSQISNDYFLFEVFFLLFLILLICISQTARINIDVVSARQLAFLENNEQNKFNEKLVKKFETKENGLSIRLNQAGIFPIIIASNLSPFVAYLNQIAF